MAWTRTDIGNQALLMLGISKLMTDVDTDTSHRASVIRECFDLAAASVDSEFPWPLSQRVEELSLVGGSSSSAYSSDWTFAYRYATYVKSLQGLVASGTSDRFLTEAGKTEYQIISDTTGKLILTDLEDASAFVNVLPEEGLYPAKYVKALALQIAILAGPALVGEMKKEVDLSAAYAVALAEAKVTAANEGGYERRPDTPSVQARRGISSARYGELAE